MKRLLGILALLILVVPATASAHQGNPDFRSEITSIRPEALADGLDVSIVNYDDHVRLINRTGKEVVIKGYDGEPLARLTPDGTVQENLNSPSLYLNQDRYANVDLPARADAKAAPEWKTVGDDATYEWHDHRSHYMGQGTPPQVKDKSKQIKVFDYRIPLEIGGEPAKLDGTLTWVGNGSTAPVIPFVILGLAIIAALAFWVTRRRRGGEAPGAGGGDGDADSPGEEKEAW